MQQATNRVRLMTWCADSVSGMHLPAFAASERGLFAAHGLDVEFVPASGGCEAVAAGAADFAFTSAVHLLAAHAAAGRPLPVRFVATFHQRNPIAAVVRDDSGLHTPADLAGARAARWNIPWFTDEYAGTLAYLGHRGPAIVDTPGSLDSALGTGAVDVLPMWIDNVTPARAQGMLLYHEGAPFAIRTIALDIPVYSTGLVAADRLPDDVVCRMRDALAAAHELRREQPQAGMSGFRRRFPEIAERHAQINWELYEPYAFDGPPPGSMSAGRWQDTIAHVARTHGFPSPREEQVFRPEALAAA